MNENESDNWIKTRTKIKAEKNILDRWSSSKCQNCPSEFSVFASTTSWCDDVLTAILSGILSLTSGHLCHMMIWLNLTTLTKTEVTERIMWRNELTTFCADVQTALWIAVVVVVVVVPIILCYLCQAVKWKVKFAITLYMVKVVAMHLPKKWRFRMWFAANCRFIALTLLLLTYCCRAVSCWIIDCHTEMEMGQWVMGQMGHHFWMGHMGHGSLPVTHWPIIMK